MAVTTIARPFRSKASRAITLDATRHAAAEIEAMAMRCVGCGICNAACPTYVLERDERDGPRGRISMIWSLFAKEAGGSKQREQPSPETRRHLGRCLSCMACATACPAGVDYGHLIGAAKARIRETTLPTWHERFVNWFSVTIIPFPRRLRWLMMAAPLAGRIASALRWVRLGEIAALAEAAPRTSGGRATFAGPGTAATKRDRRGRVILLAGCAQQVLRPAIHDATIRLLARSGIDVEVAAGAGCCGRGASETGDIEAARRFARANIDAWTKALQRNAADAIIFNSGGCGAEVRDYPNLLRDDPAYAERAVRIAGLARDVSEFLGQYGLGAPRRWSSLKVAYQSPCSLNHRQGVASQPATLIHEAGFTVVEIEEAHMCCGAGGAYAFKQPAIAVALRDRKAGHLLAGRPDVIATGSIACLKHLESAIGVPIVHTVELLDWAHGGPIPQGLEGFGHAVTDVPGPPPLNVEDYIRA